MDNSALIDISLHWIAVILYSFASLANTAGLIFKKKRLEKAGYGLIISGLFVHSAALTSRWLASGHGPYVTPYEVMSSNALIVLVAFLVSVRIFPRIRFASILVYPGAFLMLATGIFSSPEIARLPPTLSGIWLILHVSFYKVSLGTCIIALTLSLLYILKNRTKLNWLNQLPDLNVLDTYAFRFAGFGFTFWAIGLLTGSIWAYRSWGRFWEWDPVENWSLFTWGLFGLYLHLRRFFGWKGEKAAYLYLLCFFMVVFMFFFTSLLSTSIHSAYFQ